MIGCTIIGAIEGIGQLCSILINQDIKQGSTYRLSSVGLELEDLVISVVEQLSETVAFAVAATQSGF